MTVNQQSQLPLPYMTLSVVMANMFFSSAPDLTHEKLIVIGKVAVFGENEMHTQLLQSSSHLREMSRIINSEADCIHSESHLKVSESFFETSSNMKVFGSVTISVNMLTSAAE